jgi:hypothetical protein
MIPPAKPYIRCMGGWHCRHLPGQCTASPEYQEEIARMEGEKMDFTQAYLPGGPVGMPIRQGERERDKTVLDVALSRAQQNVKQTCDVEDRLGRILTRLGSDASIGLPQPGREAPDHPVGKIPELELTITEQMTRLSGIASLVDRLSRRIGGRVHGLVPVAAGFNRREA